jgi:hypothetical protein
VGITGGTWAGHHPKEILLTATGRRPVQRFTDGVIVRFIIFSAEYRNLNIIRTIKLIGISINLYNWMPPKTLAAKARN